MNTTQGITTRRTLRASIVAAALAATALLSAPTASTPAAAAPHAATTPTVSTALGASTAAHAAGRAAYSPAAARVDCRRAKCIALTFDDGPGRYTDQIRGALQAQGARATFFPVGRSANVNPGALRRLRAAGMEIGNHTYSHADLSRRGRAAQLREVSAGADSIGRAIGIRPWLVRPPYGAVNASTPTLGVPIVRWDVDTEDWRNRNAATTTRRAHSGAHRGAIILMHDIHPSTAAAVPGIVRGLKARGYTLVTVSELVGGHVQAGVTYFHGIR